ncbi:MAG: SagB/ThcOx family dehydrogenase [Gammaproteobacteria bacterium]|nr:SagB/ThcOx family dehydrogenase [Gammaproteobacteria bacterium]
MQTSPALVREYHRVSKHGKHAYAPAPGFLDWDAQPQAFRHFVDAQRFPLPFGEPNGAPMYGDLAAGTIPPAALTLETLGVFLELAFGISAWKCMGPARWALRNNPSSGNLHPSEVYVILWDANAPLPPGLYHYSPYYHCLEQLARIGDAGAEQAGLFFSGSLGALALSSVHWREEWKYGARALRYCQHDASHAMAAAAISAATQGWSLRMDEQISDQTLSALLGLKRITNEPEHPDWICLLADRRDFEPPTQSEQAWRRLVQAMIDRNGTASRLSEEYLQWPQIRKVLPAIEKPAIVKLARTRPASGGRQTDTTPPFEASALIRRRRSAQRMNPEIGMKHADFVRCLRALLPKAEPPFATIPFAPAVQLLIFVHNVEGLAPGLYAYIRNDETMEHLRQSCRDPELAWQPAPITEDATHLPLYRLKAIGEQRKLTSQLCCHQGIAGKGAFSLGMLGDFRELDHEGSWAYRRLFWEAGMIGQVLYLEAELSNLRGTGIGCYFDDSVHSLIGLPPEGDWQSLYHFTVGAGLEDSRLGMEPPYGHLEGEAR